MIALHTSLSSRWKDISIENVASGLEKLLLAKTRVDIARLGRQRGVLLPNCHRSYFFFHDTWPAGGVVMCGST